MWELPQDILFPKRMCSMGTYRTLLYGTWIMLNPLSLGDPTIEVRVAQIIPGRESENLFLDLAYNLQVVNWDL